MTGDTRDPGRVRLCAAIRPDHTTSTQLTDREIGRQEGWDMALRWLRKRASSHAGRWMTIDPRDAIKATVEDMEKLSVNG